MIFMTFGRTFTFLGTGTSVGIPMVGCRCEVCRSTNPRNQRYRCSVLITTAKGNILIDTTPELRLQLLREQVERIDAVLFTHAHADHLHGLDDLRPFSAYTGQPIPLYCTEDVEQRIRTTFGYAFGSEAFPSKAYVPKLEVNRIAEEPFLLLDERITPIPLLHAGMTVHGFRIGGVAYCTDVSQIPGLGQVAGAELARLTGDGSTACAAPAWVQPIVAKPAAAAGFPAVIVQVGMSC